MIEKVAKNMNEKVFKKTIRKSWFSKLFQIPRVEPGSIVPGSNLGRTWVDPGSNLGRTWVEPGSNLGRTWVEPGSAALFWVVILAVSEYLFCVHFFIFSWAESSSIFFPRARFSRSQLIGTNSIAGVGRFDAQAGAWVWQQRWRSKKRSKGGSWQKRVA
jgi:hypothetical protein